MAGAGDRLGGRYALVGPVGSGGMATVWRAEDVRLGRQVAVKILRPELAADPGFVRRFEAEARLAASLQHPNVATVLDTGTDGPDRFIVMELVDGPTAADLLRAHGPLPPAAAAEIGIAAARALAAAHRSGLVHRDVKPGNLLVGRDGTVRLADFGIARAFADGRTTAVGLVLGSLPYLSPEQARGGEATPSGDVYSLGVVLFELLTGRLPWVADTPAALATARLVTPPARPSAVNPSLPAGTDALLEPALAADPAARHPGADAFADAIERWRATVPRVADLPGAGLGMLASRAVVAGSAVAAAAGPDAPTVADGDVATVALAAPGSPAAPAPAARAPAARTARAGGGPSRRALALGAGLAAVLAVAALAAIGPGPSGGVGDASPSPSAAPVESTTSEPPATPDDEEDADDDEEDAGDGSRGRPDKPGRPGKPSKPGRPGKSG